MIKAAFFDIDGTLLSYYTHRITDATIQAFDAMHKAGIRTILASGRPPIILPNLPLAFDGHITMNGGYVYAGDTVIYKHPLTREDTDAWFRYCQERDICTLCFTFNDFCVNKIDPKNISICHQLEIEVPPIKPIEEMMEMEIYQLIGVMPPECDAEVMQILKNSRLPRWHNAFTDIVYTDNSKALGIELLCKHFGIDRSETIAFGDGGNDVEMLEYAKIGVAMGNAKEDVKQHADYVTLTVEEDGVAHALKELGIIQ